MYKVVYFTDFGNVVSKTFELEAAARAFHSTLDFGWIVRYETTQTITDITTPEPEPEPEPEET